MPAIVAWNLYDVSEKRYVTGWKKTERSMLKVGMLKRIDEKELRSLLPRMKRLELIFAEEVSVGDPKPLYHLSIQEICEKMPDSVTNLTDGHAPVCQVSVPN